VTAPFELNMSTTKLLDNSGGQVIKIAEKIGVTEDIPSLSSDKVMIILIDTDPVDILYANDKLEGLMTIFDVVGNEVISDVPMHYDTETQRLVTFWNGKNGSERVVGSGAYIAVAKITYTAFGKAPELYYVRSSIGIQIPKDMGYR